MGRDQMLWYCRDCWARWLVDPAQWPPIRTELCLYCRSDDLRWVPVQVSEPEAIGNKSAKPTLADGDDG